MKKTAVIFGATGLVGKEVAKFLTRKNEFDKITIIARKSPDYIDKKLEIILLSDFSELPTIKDKLKADAFFCCVGTTIKTAGSKEAFRKVDYEIPVLIAQIAESLSIHSLVVISSIGAKSKSSNFYLRTKGEMEDDVRKNYSGNLKIVRPSLLMGQRKESRPGEHIANVFMEKLGWLFIGPLKKYKGIYASEVARAMVKLASIDNQQVIYNSNELFKLL